MPMMNADEIKFEWLFDAGEYHRSGFCPWTFFAYPTILADERGLPPDDQACKLLARLQKRGIAVAIWVTGNVEDGTTYFAGRKEDLHRLHDAIQDLEDSGVIEKGFCNQGTERLFAAIQKHRTKP